MMIKPFLILQLRPEDNISDNEFEAFLRYGDLEISDTHRVRMEKEDFRNLNLSNYSGVIVGGGPYCISDDFATKTDVQKRLERQLDSLLKQVIKDDFPYLGACYGLSALSIALGGDVSKEKYKEEPGAITIKFNDHNRRDPIIKELDLNFRAFGGHKESCQSLPPNAVLLASSSTCPIQMIRYGKNVYGTQFHPELDSEGLGLRINAYKHLGYFDPSDAERLVHEALKENITVPMQILNRFVRKYKSEI